MCTPTPRQFWQRVGNAAWGEFYAGVLGMPLRDFLGTAGKSRVWRRGDWSVLTHEASVSREMDASERICLDIYVDEQGLVRRIEDVRRIWDRTEEEWAAIPGLGPWEDVRKVKYSVAFDKIEEDKDTGTQIPLSIKVSANGLQNTEADSKRFDQWVAEGRKDPELYLLAYTIPPLPYRVYDIAVDRATFRINPPLRNEDIELSFPEDTRMEGAEAAGVSCCAGRSCQIRRADGGFKRLLRFARNDVTRRG